MATRMQQRRGTAAQWTAANPILAAGEIGFETDTSKFKMGNGSSTWSALTYFANAAELAAIVDGAPDLLNTLNELAYSIGDDPAFLTTMNTAITATGTALAAHETDQTNIHGIANTALLATQSYADSAVTTHSNDSTSIHGIADTSLLATTANIESHREDTTDVHGITDTALLARLTDITNHASVTTNVHGIANTALLAETQDITDHAAVTTNVHGIADAAALSTKTYAEGVATTAKSEAITAAGTAADTKITTHNDDTTNIHGIADTAALATKTYADGAVSTAVAALTKSSVGLASVDNTADTAKPISTATQTALDLKSPLASPTFTGTVTTGHLLPATDVTFDLGSPAKMWRDIYVGPGSLYVNGQKVLQTDAGDVVVTADANENLALRTSGSGNIELDPTGAGSVNIKGHLVVEAGANFSSNDGNGIAFSNGIKADSVASNTLNTDLSLSGNGTGKVYLNDNAEVNGNLVVGGNLTVSGTTTTVNSETISLADNIIDLNSNFTTGTPTENAGIKIKRGDSSDVQIRWNESSDKWEFTTDGTNYSVIAPTDSPTFTGTVTIPAGASISGFAPLASPTFTGTVTVAAAGVAFTDGTQTKTGVPSVTTIATTLAAGARTLEAGEQDKFVPLAGAVVITLPATGYSTGQSIDFYQESSTGASFASTNGVVGTPGLNFRTTNSVATALKTSAGWLVFGDLSA